MSRIRRGTNGFKRGNARNFTQKQAQARLEETVKPFNRQVENSLYVDAVEVDIYQVNKVGKPCTCEKTPFSLTSGVEQHSAGRGAEVGALAPMEDDALQNAGSVTLQDDDIFGDSSAEKMYGASAFDVSGDLLQDDDIPEALYMDYDRMEESPGDESHSDGSMFGANANCGICYRSGFQPGYTALGKQRFVLTSLDIEKVGSYIVTTSDTPNRFKRQGPRTPSAFVDFVIAVPKYFKSCTYSVRDNTDILRERLYVEGQPLTGATLKHYAGYSLVVRVQAESFTHVVVEFDLGVDKVRANIGAETKALDYTRLEALGSFPVILPPSVNRVQNADILVIKSRRLVLKVLDIERKITADKRQLEWSVQTRLVQRTEPLRNIHQGIKIV